MKRVLRVDVHMTTDGFSVEATDYDGRTVVREVTGVSYPDVEDAQPVVRGVVADLVNLRAEQKPQSASQEPNA